jgi:hypothetical protein
LLLTDERKKYSKRISVANLDAGKMQGNRVDGFAEVIRLSENEWTRYEVRLKMFVAQDFLTGELSRASIIRTSIILTTTDKKQLPCTYHLLVTLLKYYTEYCR